MQGSKFLLNLACCCNILLNRNFSAEIVGRMHERQLFFSSIAIPNASDDIRDVMYTVLSPLRFPGQESAISSFSEYILCAKSRFHPETSQWSSGNVQ